MRRLAAVFGSLAGLASTANGYRPFARRSYPSLYAFAYGVFVSALSWLGLAGLNRIGRSADAPLTAALDAGLGTDRRTESADIWKPPGPVEVTAKTPGPLRMLRIYRDYAHDSDIAYGEYGSKNILDIWRRPDLPRDGCVPVLLQVPGGAWMVGSKRGQAYSLMSHLAELGWVCVSINYRLSPRSTWPDHIVDVKQSISWVKEHIVDYGGDPDWIAITGGSAGGRLCALAALTPNDPQFQPGFEDADTHVRAAVPFYGVYDFTGDTALHPLLVPSLQAYVFKQSRRRFPDVYRAASPIYYVSPAAPPFFVLHGSNDTLVPVEQGREFAARLKEVSRQPIVYAELPYAQHAFDIFGSARAAHAAVAVEQFLAEVYSPRNAGCRYA